MSPLTIGVLHSSLKENEHRVPLHPDHFRAVHDSVREQLIFEKGYGRAFGISDEAISGFFGGVSDREQILQESGVVLLPKPMPDDLRQLREGGILWGWPHCVQQGEITQVAIDRKLTLIAWEAMFTWKGNSRQMHLFYRNNEMAGYCAVAHALACAGLDGNYGPPLRATVLSLGSVSRGAVFALQGHGIRDIHIYTQRPPWTLHDQVLGCVYHRMQRQGNLAFDSNPTGSPIPLSEVFNQSDVIVNGILQDTESPLMYMLPGQESHLKPGSLIVDVSCDEGMGFPFAKPTSFEDPCFSVGPGTYYAVDHTPSYMWRSASWEISRALLPFLKTVSDGPEAWKKEKTISEAVEIQNGIIQNEKILSFQGRLAEYPHNLAEKV
ncbi:MAG: hypothetical protein DWQ01_06745 [Planctomycetota bacterium]|nr:MAG: hypothetical protein DWQ01_06745 [Planctomycetota bacterium]